MSITTILQEARTLAVLEPIVNRSEADVSFWGWRHIKVLRANGSLQGTLSIDALADRVIEILRGNPNFNEDERIHGKKLTILINHIYLTCDKKANAQNIFTRFLIALRDYLPYLNYDSNIRFCWEGGNPPSEACVEYGSDRNIGYNKIFEYYTQEQYRNVFGFRPSKDSHVSRDILMSTGATKAMFRWQIISSLWRTPSETERFRYNPHD